MQFASAMVPQCFMHLSGIMSLCRKKHQIPFLTEIIPFLVSMLEHSLSNSSLLLGQTFHTCLCRKTLSFQSITETVVQEIHKFLQLQPILVLVTKAPIYGEGITTSNDFQRGSSKYMSEDSTALRYPKREEERNGSCREYMPSAWQTFVTHRIKLQDLAQEAGFFSEQENEMLSVHTCEWVQPSLNSKEKFYIKNDGVGLIQ